MQKLYNEAAAAAYFRTKKTKKKKIRRESHAFYMRSLQRLADPWWFSRITVWVYACVRGWEGGGVIEENIGRREISVAKVKRD